VLARTIEPKAAIVNDIHSQLNRTTVARLARPSSIEDLRFAIGTARSLDKNISVSGGRHAMGGQQFGTDTVLLDTRGMNRVLGFDAARGILEVEAGIEWPELTGYLNEAQEGREVAWGIIQKQTGADRLTLGGALASNVHGRGLALKPIIDNIESFVLMDHTGELHRCSRQENPELFRLVVGGYGLFGIVTSVRLRLWRRKKVQRVVELRKLNEIPRAFEHRIADGYLYGDFQFATDSRRESFLSDGVFSCYRPVDPSTQITENPTRFQPKDWARLIYWAHKNKRLAFDAYSKRYLATSGQVYWSDWQLSAAYIDNYHEAVDRRLHAKVKGSEMITEIYVPRDSLVAFMEDAKQTLRMRGANVIYGTVRLIERDDESFLCWAKQSYACVIFNLHVDHTAEGVATAAESFRGLIDRAIRYDGSFYLTYHRFATRQQVEACYPQFKEFLALKLKYDPKELFQSDWYRHYKCVFRA
jgi:FAD/FMN-containing dehydrogenase